MEVKKGDLFELGCHRLLCGSSTDKNDVAKLLGGKKAKVLFTSPPYADLRDYEGGKNLQVDNIARFIACYRPYTDYQCVNLGIVRRDSEVYEYWDEYIKVARKCGYKLLSWNVWDKLSAGNIGQQTAFFPIRHEFIFVFGTKTFELNRTEEKQKENIKQGIFVVNPREKDGSRGRSLARMDYEKKKLETVVMVPPSSGPATKVHPATFPVRLPEKYILAMSNSGDGVIEPFCGSGTTLIASEKTGRVCYGMELEPKYCKVIIERWEQMTGRKAKLCDENQ